MIAEGAIYCGSSLSCAAPSVWYPDLFKPLGRPLGPAVRIGNRWTRHFEYAVSVFDVDNPFRNVTNVTFFSPSLSATPYGTRTRISPTYNATASLSPRRETMGALAAGGVNVTAIAVVVPLAGAVGLAAALLVYLRVHRAARQRRRLNHASVPHASVRHISPVYEVYHVASRSAAQQQARVVDYPVSTRSVVRFKTPLTLPRKLRGHSSPPSGSP